jgi:hypothetical protein
MHPRISLWAALFAMVALPLAVGAQVPDVQGVCVSQCGGSSGNSDALASSICGWSPTMSRDMARL